MSHKDELPPEDVAEKDGVAETPVQGESRDVADTPDAASVDADAVAPDTDADASSEAGEDTFDYHMVEDEAAKKAREDLWKQVLPTGDDDPSAGELDEETVRAEMPDDTMGPDGPGGDSAASDVPPPPPADGSATGSGGSGGSGDSGDSGDDGSEPEEGEMGLLEHMEELRIRLTRCFIAGFIGLMACYGFAEQLFDYLMMPLKGKLPEGSHLIFTGLPEGFFTYVKLSAVAGIFLASPYIFYQIWQFVAPGLYKNERRWMIPIAFFSALFFASGAAFGYIIVFPLAFEFFMGFGTDVIKPMPSLKEYLAFSLKLLFAFGVAFELPLFIFFLSRLGVVTSRGLRKWRKYAVLFAFITSAILTPPDVVSQCFMAGPLIILYELGIWVAHFLGKKPPEEDEDDEDEEEAAPA